MQALVTGAAGFIGSTLTDRLLDSGWSVRGIDSFTDYYELSQKAANVARHKGNDRFELLRDDLQTVDIDTLLQGIDVVFHQAGQPGVRLSWSANFDIYVGANIVATQRLLEGLTRTPSTRMVYASSSSIYGNADRYPVTESDLPKPHSPYGVTKLAGEHLCSLYAANHGIDVVALRYFTVYGPRQRPDMAMHRLVESALTGEPFPMYGDGGQVRDFTYVGDVVEANLAASAPTVAAGTVVNIAGGGSISLRSLIDEVSDAAGRAVIIEQFDAQDGDVQRTGGSTEAAARELGWTPTVSVSEGVRHQVEWHRQRHLDQVVGAR